MTRPEAGVPRSRWEQICPLLPQLMARHAPCPRQSSRAAVKSDLWFSVSWAAVTSFFSEGAPEMGDPPLHRRGLGGAHEHTSRARPPIRGYRTRNFLRKATLLPRGVVIALERNSWSGLCAFGLSRKRPRLMFD